MSGSTPWWRISTRISPTTDSATNAERFSSLSGAISLAKFVTSASDAEFASGLGDYLDIDEFARFMAVNVWLCNMDSILAMGQNFYVYLHPETKKFMFLPWDL